MSFDRARLRPRLAVTIGLCLASLGAAGCSVKRVGVADPAATGSSSKTPYDFQAEQASPPAPAVDTAAATGSQAAPNLETPAPVDLDTPSVTVQDLPAPSTPAPGSVPQAATAPAASNPAATGGAAAPGNAPAPARSGAQAGGQGYRVQIFAGSDADAAERVRREAAARLGVPAYVTYQAPFYKVRVGNCPTSDGCRDLQARLRDAGYDTVWIVADTIEP
jgi:hypothetical protein